MTVDISGVYVVGTTTGGLPGQTNLGDADAFVRKYDSAGNEHWTRQFGTTANDQALSVATDATGVYVVGETSGVFPGETQSTPGSSDAFVRKYDINGNMLWTRQFGSTIGPTQTHAHDVAADGSGVYVVGWTVQLPGQSNIGNLDAFIRKYEANGNELWTQQFGSVVSDLALAVAVEASGVYVVGTTEGTLPFESSAGGVDAFVRKYDLSGNELWTRQFGSGGSDSGTAVAADVSGVYVVGFTTDALLSHDRTNNFGDTFVKRYDSGGNELWTRRSGTVGDDFPLGAAVNGFGLYIVGFVAMNTPALGMNRLPPPGLTGRMQAQAVVRRFSLDGDSIWTRTLVSTGGTTGGNDTANTVAADASGIYVAGTADGSLQGEPSSGGGDAFLARFSDFRQ